MFDQKKRSSTAYIWIAVLIAAIAIIAAIQLVRVNPPQEAVNASVKPIWTNGSIVSGNVTVAANQILMFNVNLNKRSDLKGTFTTGDNSKRLGSLMIKETDLEAWRSGKEVPVVFSTGPVPRGTITREVEPGRYRLIFDNRANDKEINLSEVDFSVE